MNGSAERTDTAVDCVENSNIPSNMWISYSKWMKFNEKLISERWNFNTWVQQSDFFVEIVFENIDYVTSYGLGIRDSKKVQYMMIWLDLFIVDVW